jgi:hypothetical protein
MMLSIYHILRFLSIYITGKIDGKGHLRHEIHSGSDAISNFSIATVFLPLLLGKLGNEKYLLTLTVRTSRTFSGSTGGRF